MTRVLIGWASRAGAAHDIATVLADELRALGHDADVSDLKDGPDAAACGLVVLGSGIQAGQWYPEALAWVTENEAVLATRPVAVFNVCLNAANPAKREESLAYNKGVLARVAPVSQETFAGRYVPGKVAWYKRLFLRGLKQSAQNHIDDAAVRAWARDLAALLPH